MKNCHHVWKPILELSYNIYLRECQYCGLIVLRNKWEETK